MTDNKTTVLELPLPSEGGDLDVDVLRIIRAFKALDAFAGETNTTLAQKATTASLDAMQTTITAEIATRIAALVDSSPEALNTLNELAAALGDDPNFAATTIAAIAAAQSAADSKWTMVAASELAAGIARQATNDEASTGVEGSLFVTPSHLQTYGVPSGVIVMWSGATDAVPTGWALCDGENSTPDLRDCFVVGAGSTYDVGDTGGSATVSGTVGATTLTVAQMPGHAHSARYASSSASSGTRVNCLLRTTPTTADGTTTVLNNTGSSQSHTHSFSGTAFANLPPYYALAYIMKL